MKSIYSRKAILGFSAFFTPLLGGLLLRTNLNEIGKRKEGNIVLLTSLFLTFIAVGMVLFFEIKGGGILSLVSGWLLTELFYNTHFENEKEYKIKSIKKPLVISLFLLAAVSVLFLFVYYNM